MLATLLVVIAIPFALKPRENLLAPADDTVVIISPHNEAVRHEFSVAFAQYYKNKTGRSVRIDWRLPGGTSEISRYLAGEYLAAFERVWTANRKAWSPQVAASFDNPRITPAPTAAGDSLEQAARRAFWNPTPTAALISFWRRGLRLRSTRRRRSPRCLGCFKDPPRVVFDRLHSASRVRRDILRSRWTLDRRLPLLVRYLLQ